MPELPPQSRVISRIDGEILSITLPQSRAIGCIGGSWAGAAVFSFLAICSFAQGTFSGNLIWTGAGFFFFLFTGWQLLALRGGILRPRNSQTRNSTESFAIVSGPADTPHRRSWPRSAITGIRVEPKKTAGPTSLFLELRDEPRIGLSLFRQ